MVLFFTLREENRKMEQRPKPTFQDLMTQRLKQKSAREQLDELNRQNPCLDGSINDVTLHNGAR